ncbi:hypothetical protein BKA82DRAFT_4447900 [Pisolithus tinctorius]|nr:hypothetical protein BKA82DRAFT_4447900 [Pisolithus tinctorius]
MDQLVKTMKPIVDLIGNCETHEASLAFCMLELICCARKMSQLGLESSDHAGFFMHMKQVFNHCFHAMNTEHHSLALFLHPIFEFMVTTALWSEAEAKNLVHNLKEYQKCTGVFAGGQPDTLEWWEHLPITAKQCPLKALAIVLRSVVPHAADVERYFSGLGGTQSTKHSLSKLRLSYAHHLYKMDRTHTHMHMQLQLGIDVELAEDLMKNFMWIPPLAAKIDEDEYLAGPEMVTDEELVEAFENLNHLNHMEEISGALDLRIEIDGNKVLEGQLYSWDELEIVDKGIIPSSFVEEISVHDKAAGVGQWDIMALWSSEGVSTSR